MTGSLQGGMLRRYEGGRDITRFESRMEVPRSEGYRLRTFHDGTMLVPFDKAAC